MIKLGFIGIGGYGKVQLEGFRPFHQSGRIAIRALADSSYAALADAGLEGADLFTDYQEMLDSVDLDAVVISAPIPLHLELALEAIDRGLFVLLEKPPVPLLSQLRQLIAADSRRRVMVGFQHLYTPLLRRAKAAVTSGEIGRLNSIRAAGIWPRGSAYYLRSRWAGQLFHEGRPTLDGPCTNAMAHYLNSLLYLGGDAPGTYADPARLEAQLFRARPLASYDLAGIWGELSTGCDFSLALSHASTEPLPVRIRLEGTEGSLELIANATQLRDPQGRVLEGGDGRPELRQAFLEFVEGNSAINLTRPADMMPYVLTTNLMFQSAGGIQDLDPALVSLHRPHTPEAIYAVRGLKDHFTPLGRRFPWGAAPASLTPADFHEQTMLNTLTRSTPALVA
jgi:predicted dehydrogenase